MSGGLRVALAQLDADAPPGLIAPILAEAAVAATSAEEMASADGLILLGHVHASHATFAKQLAELVGTDLAAELFQRSLVDRHWMALLALQPPRNFIMPPKQYSG